MTTFVRTWNAAYEANPPDSQNASQGAARIREIKTDVQERAEVDHSWAGDTDDGSHKKVTFVDPLGVKPVQANDETYLYTKDVDATSELFYEDEPGVEAQLTKGGYIYSFPTGTKMLFQQTTAPLGWTKDTTHNDKAIRIVSGTASSGGTKAFTTTFGTSKTTDSHALSTTQIPAHTHGSTGAHTHTLQGWNPQNSGVGGMTDAIDASSRNTHTTSSNGAHTHASVGGSGGHTHNLANFDLQYVDFIIATKD